MRNNQLTLNLSAPAVKPTQRADYTFKYNRKLGRHGWLRLTPAYSVKLVQEIFDTYRHGGNRTVYDPFCGTGTTALVAAQNGWNALTTDINPFLVWFATAKNHEYGEQEVVTARMKFNALLEELPTLLITDNWQPEIHNINRWWEENTLNTLSALRTCTVQWCGEARNAKGGDALIWIAFCRLVIETSSAAFNHVSMSFKAEAPMISTQRITYLFNTIFENILRTVHQQPITGQSTIILSDSRKHAEIADHSIDLVITSPPYVNRISYIRELRPYMYWTKFLEEKSEAGAIDWQAIGGTWGTATSNLLKWSPSSNDLPQRMMEVCASIRNADNKHAFTMHQYVMKYFDDMNLHVAALTEKLKRGATVHYIIGNSNFYGHCVEAEKIYEDLFVNHGFTDVTSRIIRKRNSHKKLFEYEVTARFEA